MIKIVRTYLPNATKGDGAVYQNNVVVFSFKTLELPWKENQDFISCIPAGKYTCVKRKSAKYGEHFHVMDVPERDMILIHHGNYTRDVLGCILPGQAHTDIDKDGIIDVTNSKATMTKLLSVLPNKFILEIA